MLVNTRLYSVSTQCNVIARSLSHFRSLSAVARFSCLYGFPQGFSPPGNNIGSMLTVWWRQRGGSGGLVRLWQRNVVLSQILSDRHGLTYGCRTTKNRGCNYKSGKVISLSCSWYDTSDSDLASIVFQTPCWTSRAAAAGSQRRELMAGSEKLWWGSR